MSAAEAPPQKKLSYGHCLHCGAMFSRDGHGTEHGPERGEPRQYCTRRCKNRQNYLNRKAAANRMLPERPCAKCGIHEGEEYAEAREYRGRVKLGFGIRIVKRTTNTCWKAKLVTRNVDGVQTILCGRCNSARSRELFKERVPENERWRYATRKFELRKREQGTDPDRIRRAPVNLQFTKDGQPVQTTGTVTVAVLKARIEQAKRAQPLPDGLTPAETIRALRSDTDDQFFAYLDAKQSRKR